MTSSKSWICDGIPKDGKEYPDLGGAHDPYVNYAPDCDECGLPKESSVPSSQSIPITTVIIAAVALVIVMAGGGVFYAVKMKGCETGLEKIDGQCIDPFLQAYQDAAQQGDGAITIANSYQTLEDLEQAQLTLANAVTKLVQIPSEALVYRQVETKLEEYDQKRVEINNNITKEKAAQEKLNEVATLASVAKEETDLAKTTSQLTAAKQQWKEAKNKLKEIDNTSLIASQIGQHQSDYDQEIKLIDERIAKLNIPPTPAPKPKPYRPRRTSPTPKQVVPAKPRVKPNTSPYDPCAVENPPSNCRF